KPKVRPLRTLDEARLPRIGDEPDKGERERKNEVKQAMEESRRRGGGGRRENETKMEKNQTPGREGGRGRRLGNDVASFSTITRLRSRNLVPLPPVRIPRCFEPVSYRVCCSSKRSKDIGSIWRLGIVRRMYSKPKGTNLIFGSTVQCYRGDNITTLAKQQPNQAYTEPACT
ncbi:unnamed protein product, partial [Heterotrigona itama]